MYKDGVLTIADWQKAQANSPYVGFDTMRNVDITSTPGVLKAGLKPNLDLDTTGVPGIPVARVVSRNGDVYVLVAGTVNSVLYKNGVNITNVVGVGRDMVEYKGYLIISAGSALHCIGTSISTAYFSNWQTGLDSANYLKMVVSKSDGNIYIANGVNIKRISAFVIGSFAVAPTCTFDTAITLPDGYYAITIAELGSRLMVGTSTATSWFGRSLSQEASIFPYRIGVSATAFDDPITIANANCVQQIKVCNGIMYITAGDRGNLYISNGTKYTQVRTIPYFNGAGYYPEVTYYPNAISINRLGNLVIGISVNSNGDNGGIYEINITSGNYEVSQLNLLELPDGYSGGDTAVGFIQQDRGSLMYYGFQSVNTYGVYSVYQECYGNYEAVVESPLYIIGNKLNPKTFENVELTFGRPLVDAQGVKIYYRNSISGNWTLTGTFDFTTFGSVNTIRGKALIPTTSILQIKIALTADTTSLLVPSPELLTVTFW